MTSARTPPTARRPRGNAGTPASPPAIAFERDVYLVMEHQARAGMNRLERQGKQATAMEAAMTKEAEGKEAGS